MGRALIWTDERAGEQRAHIRGILGDELGPITGNEIYDQPEPRMLWMRDTEPERYYTAHKFLTTVSFLMLRLTGRIGANRSDWGFHLSFDREAGDWNRRFTDAVGLDVDKFPPLYDPWEIVGGVSPHAARETGLAAGTPVVAGGQDATVSALAIGALEPGDSVYMRGTTDLLSVMTAKADYHPDLYTTRAVLPGLYMSYDMKEVVAAGGSLKWLAMTLFGSSDPDTYEQMNSLAAESHAGANGILFLPYLLMTTAPDPSLERGGSFFGLSVNTSRGDLCRAVMESTAYALRETIDRLRAAGIEPRDLRTTGGPTRSPLWNQITADVTRLPIILPTDAAGAAYGAALLAGLGVGLYPMDDGYKALGAVISLGARFLPHQSTSRDYDLSYNVFEDLARSTAGYAPRLR
jgi:xylulokinase